ncbi:hypothetical protein ACXPWS_05210 [Mycobacterium sp. BMJ-28]
MATDHFEKHKSARERTDWNFNVLFNDQPQVAQYAAQYGPMLNHPGLYQPILGEWLHATILRVGFVEDFSDKEMFEVARGIELKLAKIRVPDLLLGQWWIWGGNPCVHFTPEGPLQEIFNIVVGELRAVIGNDRLPYPLTFTPHISLAYSKTYNDEAGLFRQLATTHFDAVPVQAKRLSLVKQHVRDNYYIWEVAKHLTLGQGLR